MKRAMQAHGLMAPESGGDAMGGGFATAYGMSAADFGTLAANRFAASRWA
jgi:hypothetical protein